jgi:hypothetical protein
MTALAALVKDTHRLVCTSDLNLHKVGRIMATFGTVCLRSVNVLPRILAPQNGVHFLALQISFLGHFGCDFTRIGTRCTDKAVSAVRLLRRHLQQRAIERTKPHACFLSLSPAYMAMMVRRSLLYSYVLLGYCQKE